MNKRHGFTLIELLVVVGIIAILSSVGVAVFSNAQRNARDARRRADMRAVQSASELYYQSSGQYPTASSSLSGFLENDAMPADPRAAWTSYAYSFTAARYNHCARLEISAASSSFCVENLQ